jgi:hypothetical protein
MGVVTLLKCSDPKCPTCTQDLEKHRRECEARYVVKLDEFARTDYYNGVWKSRGEEAAKLLIQDVVATEELYKKVQDARAGADHAA